MHKRIPWIAYLRSTLQYWVCNEVLYCYEHAFCQHHFS